MGRKRKSAQRVLEAKLERSWLRLMPEFPKLLGELAVRAEAFDGSEPKTFLASVEHDFKAFAMGLQGRHRRIRRFALFLLGRFASAVWARKFALEFIALTKRSAASDRRYSLLIKFMHDVDQNIPFASLVVALHYADPQSSLVAHSIVLKSVTRAEKASGEARAMNALDAVTKTVDLVYKPYLIALWRLSYFKDGKNPPEVPGLGNIQDVCIARLSHYPGLLEPDAVWLRNSAVHEVPDYIPEEDSIWMWDRTHSRRKVRVDDLIALTRRISLISIQTIQRVSQLYLLRFLLNTGLIDMAVACISYEVTGDEKRLKDAEARIKAYGESLMEPLTRFLEQGTVEP